MMVILTSVLSGCYRRCWEKE